MDIYNKSILRGSYLYDILKSLAKIKDIIVSLPILFSTFYLLEFSFALFDVDLERESVAELFFILLSDTLLLPVFFEDVFLLLFLFMLECSFYSDVSYHRRLIYFL